MIKKLLVAVAAIVMLMGTALVVDVVGSSVAGAATPPPTNYNCAVGGSVTFQSPGLSAGGASPPTRGHHQDDCDADGIGLLGRARSRVTVASATTPCPQTDGVPNSGDPSACLASKTKNGVTTYAIARSPTTTTPPPVRYERCGRLAGRPAGQADQDHDRLDLGHPVHRRGRSGVAGGRVRFGRRIPAHREALSGTTPVSTFTFSRASPVIPDRTPPGTSSPTLLVDRHHPTATVGGASSLTLSLPNVSCTSADGHLPEPGPLGRRSTHLPTRR